MPRNMNPLDRARAAFMRAVGKSQYQIQERGIVGWQISASQVVIRVPGRPNFLYVTRPDKTVHIARNQLPVPQSAFYPVRMVLEDDTYVIVARDNLDGNVFDLIPDSPSGVLPHPISEHSDVTITAAASGDVLAHNGTNWVDSTNIPVAVAATIHAATAKTTPVDADTMPLIDSAASNVLKKVTWANIKETVRVFIIATANTWSALQTVPDNLFTLVDNGDATKAAQFQLSGISTATTRTFTLPNANTTVVGTDVAQTLTNKTLDSTNISTLTAKTTPVDADSAVIVDSAAANVFKRTPFTDLKAFLKTYFDTLYAAVANGVTGGNSHDHVGGDGAQIDHGGIGGLSDDDHSQYALLAGRAGGQALKGGTGSGDDLTLESTNHATKGDIFLQPNGGDVVFNPSANATIKLGTLSVTEGATTYDSGFFVNAPTDEARIVIVRAVATNVLMIASVTGDTFRRFFIQADGALLWGPGNATRDTNLYRSAADHLKTDDSLIVETKLLVGLDTGNANILGIKAGTSSNDAAVGGVLFVSTTQAGNVGGGEDDLASYSVPANTLSVNGQSLWVEASGTIAAVSGTKTLRVRFGTTGTNLILEMATGGTTLRAWKLRGRIFRTGAATQKGSGTIIIGGTLETDIEAGLDQTLSGAITLKVTGESTNAANNDIVIESFICGWDDANV